jgi:dolichyl-phosphate-mannose--protein O-mannosyl transferase
MIVAGLIVLLFLLDLGLAVFGRMILLDIMFILSGAFVLWQGIETIRELR